MSTYPLTREAVSYSWRQLLTRAGADPDQLPLTLSYGENTAPSSRAKVIIRRCAASAARALLERAPNSLDWLPVSEVVPAGSALPISEPIPILFWGKGADQGHLPFASQRADGTIEFHADLIAAVFFMLSRWEETVVAEQDEHGRFPGVASVAYRQGFLDRPVVDEYALILCEWLRVILPGWEPKPRSFSVKLSHDVDYIRRYANAQTVLQAVGGHLLKRRSPKMAWRAGLDAVRERLAPEQAPYFLGIAYLARMSQEHGLGRDAFYFMATEPAALDHDYRLASPMILRTFEDLRKQGFEIGLHAGYHTLHNPVRVMEETAKLDNILGETPYGGRQHYLRFKGPHTWRCWEQAGLSYDSTMAFADHEGFRCGTCHPFRPFDIEQNREMDLWELPLLVMEYTLSQYRGLSPSNGETRILALAHRCQQVGGTFTLLWHNSSLDDQWQPWAGMYLRVLDYLAELGPRAPNLAVAESESRPLAT